jgi:uncharacterized protein involved in exopolysaccharide biosynthesis
MKPNEDYVQQVKQDDEIDLVELWSAIWAGKFLIIAISSMFAISSIFYALSQPNIYRATTLLASANADGGVGGLARMAGQFGGLASLAGVNLGGGGSDKTGLALEILKSRRFLESFITKHELLVPLMAAKNWDLNSNTLILDEDIYNYETKTWIRDVKAPKKPEPSSWEAFRALKEILSVTTDAETGMVTITIDFYSPEVATHWLLWLVADINETMREKDNVEAKNRIEFLTKKLEETKLADMQEVFYELIEEQTKTLMLAEVSKEYVLKTIDPPNAPEEKAKPKRPLIVVLGTLLGGMLAVIIVLVRYFFKKTKEASKLR